MRRMRHTGWDQRRCRIVRKYLGMPWTCISPFIDKLGGGVCAFYYVCGSGFDKAFEVLDGIANFGGRVIGITVRDRDEAVDFAGR